MKTSINTIFSPNIGLYWKDRQFSSSRFEIVKLGKIVDLKMNFKNLYWKMQFFHKVFGKNAVKTTKNKKPKKIRHHVWRPLISKRPFERASIFIKKMTATHFICIIKLQIAIIFSFNENKQWKRVSVQIFRNIERAVVSLSKISRPQIFVRE